MAVLRMINSQHGRDAASLGPAGVLPRRVTLVCRGLSLHGLVV